MKMFTDFLREEQAATAVEYAIMLAMILMAVFATVEAVGQNTNAMYGDIQTEMESHGIK
jgi:Flp pilus assembly pilin Flp